MLASFVMFAATAANLPDKPSLGSHIGWVVMLWAVAMTIVAGVASVALNNRAGIIRKNRIISDEQRPVPTRWKALRRAKIAFVVVVVIAAASTYSIVRSYDNAHQNYQAQARIESAGNARTPPEALEVLAGDERPDVRLAAATNERTPTDVLAALASDSDTDVRVAVRYQRAHPDRRSRSARVGFCDLGAVMCGSEPQLSARGVRNSRG